MPSSSATTTTSKRRKTESPASALKKNHVCVVCSRGFSTTGHLARHSRVHTGERNHKCPFPGCETKCSRQDNLQQHYRIHLSPGSRRKSGRTLLRSESTPAPSPPALSPASDDASQSPPYRIDSPPLEPPPLEDSRPYLLAAQGICNSPPNTPPPLAEASYPVLTHRTLPHIKTSVVLDGPSSRSSPDEDWGSQRWTASPVSDNQSSAVSAYQSPAQYGHSTATSPQISPIIESTRFSYSSLNSSSYSSLAGSEAYVYEQPRVIHAPHPLPAHVDPQNVVGQYTHSLSARPSISPPIVSVARSRSAGHSIAHLPHEPMLTQQSYTPQDSPSPPPSSQQSPLTPYTTFHEEPAYAQHHEVYHVYDAQGRIVTHPQSYDAQMVPAVQYHAGYSPPLLLAALPSLRRESYPQVATYAHPQAHPETPCYEQYAASQIVTAPTQSPYAHLHHPQPQPPIATEYLNEYGWKLQHPASNLESTLVPQ